MIGALTVMTLAPVPATPATSDLRLQMQRYGKIAPVRIGTIHVILKKTLLYLFSQILQQDYVLFLM